MGCLLFLDLNRPFEGREAYRFFKEEAQQMIEAAQRNGVYLMVGHNQRLMPPHVKQKKSSNPAYLGKQ